MWMLLVLFVAAALGLSSRPERWSRLAVIPVVLMLVSYQALKFGLL